MKKFINNVDEILTESLTGFGDAHNDILEVKLKPDFVTRKQKSENPKVALISGGGSGHEPLHGGFVGYGMLDAACPGQVFSAPTPDQMEAAANYVHSGKGILFIVKNYSGDIMNFEMGAEMLDLEHKTIIVNDDVAVEDSTFTTGRRGVAGTMIIEKTVGSLAEAGASLDECKTFGDHVNKMTASMGVAFTSCTVPAAGKPTFDIGDPLSLIDVSAFGGHLTEWLHRASKKGDAYQIGMMVPRIFFIKPIRLVLKMHLIIN